MLNYLEDVKEIETKIETTRKSLHDLIHKNGNVLGESKVVEISQFLDQLIVNYIRKFNGV